MLSDHCMASKPALALLGVLAAAQAAQADGDYFSPTDEHVRISLGVMHVSSNTTLRADSTAGATGTLISGESTFGLDRSDFEPKFEVKVRAATRQRLTFDYFTLDRTGSTTLTGGDVAFKDVTFLPGDPLQTKLDLRTFGITYEYSFWHADKLEIAGTLGVHATDISAVAKVQTPTRHIFQETDQAGPVPTLGIDATWVVSRRFYLDGRAQYLQVNTGSLGGSLGIYDFDVLYRYRPNVSFALGYTDIRATILSNKSQQAESFVLNTKGPEAFFRIAF